MAGFGRKLALNESRVGYWRLLVGFGTCNFAHKVLPGCHHSHGPAIAMCGV